MDSQPSSQYLLLVPSWVVALIGGLKTAAELSASLSIVAHNPDTALILLLLRRELSYFESVMKIKNPIK